LKEQRKQEKAEARKRFVNPFKEGDILHHSWGYEQTNCDFYQVVAVTKSTVTLRPIACKPVPGSEGFMTDKVMPDKDHFTVDVYPALFTEHVKITVDNPSVRKKVSFYVKPDKELRYFIPVPYGWCDLWDGKPQHRSWYA
jgi:hypothetical protein